MIDVGVIFSKLIFLNNEKNFTNEESAYITCLMFRGVSRTLSDIKDRDFLEYSLRFFSFNTISLSPTTVPLVNKIEAANKINFKVILLHSGKR